MKGNLSINLIMTNILSFLLDNYGVVRTNNRSKKCAHVISLGKQQNTAAFELETFKYVF